MSWNYQPDYEFDKEIDIDVDTNLDFDTEIDLKKEVDIDVNIDVKANVEGNTAILVGDVEAIGKDTYVEVNTAVLTVEDELSMVSIVAESAVA
jgi:hypothetical protein